MRRAFTIVEALVGLSVMVLAAALVHEFYVSAGKGTALSVEQADALRSVLIASEFIRTDLGEMRFLDVKKDIAIEPANKKFSVYIPPVLSPDLWSGNYFTVIYELERIPGTPGVSRLMRRMAGKSPEPLANCLLKDMIVRIVPARGAVVPWHPTFAPAGVSAYQGYLEVTLVGTGSLAGRSTYTSTILHPLTYMSPPEPYQLITEGTP